MITIVCTSISASLGVLRILHQYYESSNRMVVSQVKSLNHYTFPTTLTNKLKLLKALFLSPRPHGLEPKCPNRHLHHARHPARSRQLGNCVPWYWTLWSRWHLGRAAPEQMWVVLKLQDSVRTITTLKLGGSYPDKPHAPDRVPTLSLFLNILITFRGTTRR